MTNGEKIIVILKPRKDQIRIYGNWVEIEMQKLGINFSCGLDWWNTECNEPTTPNDCETCIHNKGVLECDMYGCKYEPTTKKDLAVDAVSRQAINGYIDYILSHGMGKKKSFEFIKKFVANLPPVTPQEPRKGNWILKKNVFDKFGNTVECSSCHKKWKTYDEVRWRKENKFCPNCGSDNREVEE